MSPSSTNEKALGVLFGVLSAIFVAGYVTTNKYIYTHYDISAIEYTLIFAMSGAVFALGSLLFQMDKGSRQSLKGNFISLFALGVAGAMAVGTFVVGQQYTTAVNASLLMTSTIVATALFSHFFLKEQHSKLQYVWMIALFVGLYIGVVGFRSIQLKSGDLIILGSVLFFGFGNAYSRVVMKRMGSARLVPDIRLIIGGILALLTSLFVIRNTNIIMAILPLVLVGGLFYWLCMKAFARAVYLVNANNAIVLNNSQIFFTSLAGVLILSESYSIEKLVGSIVAITAIYFIAGKY